MITKIKLIKFIFCLILCFISVNEFTYGKQKMINKNSIIEEKINWDLLVQNNLKLVIYYNDFKLLTNIPLKESDLIKGYYSYKITVNTRILRNYIEELKQLSAVTLSKLDKQAPVNIRVYCEFLANNDKVFSFSLNSFSEYMLVNGNQVRSNKLYYNFILNFLPQSEAENCREIIKNIKF